MIMKLVPGLSMLPTESARHSRWCLETVDRVTRELLEDKKRQAQEDGLEDDKRDLLSLLCTSQSVNAIEDYWI
jgi:hypothetical protein